MNKRDFSIKYLSESFCRTHSTEEFPELELKSCRPYVVYLVKIRDNTFAIPFRSNIRHSYCYKFKTSTRATDSSTGLDYTKAVIVNSADDIGDNAHINDREFLELDKMYYHIFRQFEAYVNSYYKFTENKLNDIEAKAYRFSTLKYFHKELGINNIGTE